MVIRVVRSDEILEDGFEDVEFGLETSCSRAETGKGKSMREEGSVKGCSERSRIENKTGQRDELKVASKAKGSTKEDEARHLREFFLFSIISP